MRLRERVYIKIMSQTQHVLSLAERQSALQIVPFSWIAMMNEKANNVPYIRISFFFFGKTQALAQTMQTERTN